MRRSRSILEFEEFVLLAIGLCKKRPVRSLPPSKPLTGPAPPRRSVCAPAKVVFAIVKQTALTQETYHEVPLGIRFSEIPQLRHLGRADKMPARAPSLPHSP